MREVLRLVGLEWKGATGSQNSKNARGQGTPRLTCHGQASRFHDSQPISKRAFAGVPGSVRNVQGAWRRGVTQVDILSTKSIAQPHASSAQGIRHHVPKLASEGFGWAAAAVSETRDGGLPQTERVADHGFTWGRVDSALSGPRRVGARPERGAPRPSQLAGAPPRCLAHMRFLGRRQTRANGPWPASELCGPSIMGLGLQV